MDLIDFDNVKSEKAKALHRYRSIRLLFRVAEICVALLLLYWLFTCLPFVFRISGEFLSRIACVVSTPLFMFVLGNSIVIALLATKSTVSTASRTFDGEEADIYEAFIRSGENRADSYDEDLTDEIVYDDKQMIITETDSNSNSAVTRKDHVRIRSENDSDSVTNSVTDHHTKIYRRSKSEISAKQSPEILSKPSLRRSETEKCRKIIESSCELPLNYNYPEDKLTNEEFQKTIEAFIAKQLIFRRRESLAVVVHKKI